MEKHILKATKRTVLGRKVKTLRKAGFVPASVYGKSVESQTIQVSLKEFLAVYEEVGETGLVDLTIDAKAVPVLVHILQYHPVTQELRHIDFYQVNLKEKLRTYVPVTIVGESPAVKDKIATLLTLLTEIEVEAYPADIPEEIEVDISGLTEIDQTITVEQLKAPSTAKIMTDPAQDVVKLAELVAKEVEEPEPAAPTEGAEGETPTEEGAKKTEGNTKEAPSEE